MNSPQRLQGIIPPVVTPFYNDDVDYDAFREELHRYINMNVNGVAIGGSTGEGYALTDDELRRLTEIALEIKKNNFLVIVGIITDSTYQAIRRALMVKDLNVDALMITPPHYLFNAGDESSYLFYKRLHERTGMPIIIYNVIPWNTVSTSIIRKLAEEGIIVGVKQSGGDIHALSELLINTKIPILTALDDMLFPSFTLGASGSIAAVNTLLPRTSIRLFNAVKAGNYEEARRLHEEILPIVRIVIQQPDMPTRIKYVMNNIGWKVGYAREPLPQFPSQDTAGKLMEVAYKVKELEGY
ncbi:dihydrodipicolinate synthase family protein [Caldivirga sp. UBA161]|uniref:dihydrodipicolinate synthase family protein n=1 Tax=Caldivirga sp. UBA161 TaxID=1915569 RepID=UPI0025C3D68E|nr:dihydrodipicolinate synthase family protein [Caldivirga sp. UBA161]